MRSSLLIIFALFFVGKKSAAKEAKNLCVTLCREQIVRSRYPSAWFRAIFALRKFARGAVEPIISRRTYGKAERFLLLFDSFSFKKKKSPRSKSAEHF